MSEQGLERIETTRQTTHDMSDGEAEKVLHALPKDMQSLFPAIASAV